MQIIDAKDLERRFPNGMQKTLLSLRGAPCPACDAALQRQQGIRAAGSLVGHQQSRNQERGYRKYGHPGFHLATKLVAAR